MYLFCTICHCVLMAVPRRQVVMTPSAHLKNSGGCQIQQHLVKNDKTSKNKEKILKVGIKYFNNLSPF